MGTHNQDIGFNNHIDFQSWRIFMHWTRNLLGVGDDKVGGPAVSHQLQMIRLLMQNLLIAINYLLHHTELRLENVHISPVDRHIKILVLEECRRIWSGLRVGIVFRRLSVLYQFGVNSSEKKL